MDNWIGLIGVIVGAIIAGLFSFISIIINNKQNRKQNLYNDKKETYLEAITVTLALLEKDDKYSKDKFLKLAAKIRLYGSKEIYNQLVKTLEEKNLNKKIIERNKLVSLCKNELNLKEKQNIKNKTTND